MAATELQQVDHRTENDATPDVEGPLAPHTLSETLACHRNEVTRGGYRCEFVELPPAAFQTACSVCLHILKEPCVVDCCDTRFCGVCIELVEKDNKPCPLCGKTEFKSMKDDGLERSLKKLEVWCSYRKDGCNRKGKLGDLELHLNQNPHPQNRLKGCQFVEVECTHNCGKWFQRHHIIKHETELCKERPYSCNHCRDYHSTFQDVNEIHSHQCSKYPIACPNECQGDMFMRQELESHLRDKCPCALVYCPFHYAGCQTQLPRKDMPEHMKETVTHLALLASVTESLVKENLELRQNMKEKELQCQDKIHTLEMKVSEQNHELQQTTVELRQKTEELYQKELLYRDKQRATDDEVRYLKKEVHELKLQHARIPVDFRVRKTSGSVYSPAFYTHPHGFRMLVRVDPNGNLDGRETHVSIYTCLMRGPFDDHLKWPFRGEITIQIVNQAGDHDHVEKTIQYHDKLPDDVSGRVVGKDMTDQGRGYSQFIAHYALRYNAAKRTQYLIDNHFRVRIVRVTVNK